MIKNETQEPFLPKEKCLNLTNDENKVQNIIIVPLPFLKFSFSSK